MFFFRDIKSDSNKAQKNIMQVAAIHDDLPCLLNENWAERWCTLRNEFKDVCEQIHNFEVRVDDVFVVTFMKCGTTWMQELTWQLTHELNFQMSREVSLSQRSQFLEFAMFSPELTKTTMDKLNEQPSVRVTKTHLPVNLLPKQLWQKQAKVIFVARNVKDVIVSSFHFNTGLNLWSGTIEEYMHDFMHDAIYYTPYWAQIVDFWKLRHEPHIFFVTFEEMKRDLPSVIQRLCTFLERPQLTEQELKDILQHVSFENMKQNKSMNITKTFKTKKFEVKDDFQFMRSGAVGSYKADLSAENVRLLNEWSRSSLAKYGITEEDIFGKIEN